MGWSMNLYDLPLTEKKAYVGTVAKTLAGAAAGRYAPTATGAALGYYNSKQSSYSPTDVAYILGAHRAMEKTSAAWLANAAKAGRTLWKGRQGLGKSFSNAGSTAFNRLQSMAPNALATGSRGANLVKGTGKMLASPAFHIMGGLNAYATDGTFMDKTKAYALGGAIGTAGWGAARNASKRLASGLVRNPGASGSALKSSMRSAGMNRTIAAQAGSAHSRGLAALKAGDFKQYEALEKSRKALMATGMKNMNFGQKLKFNLTQNPAYKSDAALGLTGLAGALYGTNKMKGSLESLAGISPEQLARKQQERHYAQMQKNMNSPMRNNTVMSGNNPYS
jgi:hypothetical protein